MGGGQILFFFDLLQSIWGGLTFIKHILKGSTALQFYHQCPEHGKACKFIPFGLFWHALSTACGSGSGPQLLSATGSWFMVSDVLGWASSLEPAEPSPFKNEPGPTWTKAWSRLKPRLWHPCFGLCILNKMVSSSAKKYFWKFSHTFVGL